MFKPTQYIGWRNLVDGSPQGITKFSLYGWSFFF